MRRNKYGQKHCFGCGKYVKANDGLLFKNDNKWEVVHDECNESSGVTFQHGGGIPMPAPKVSYNYVRGGDTYVSCGHEDYPCCGC